MKQINWLGWGLGATQVLLCGALAMAWLTPQMEIKNSRWQPPEPIKADVQALLPKQPETPELGIRQEDQLMLQMQERPLFALSRRPPPPATVKKPDEEPAEQDQWAKAKIMGLFDGAVSGAIVQYAGKEQRLLVSQSLGGWMLSRVFDREIELESGGRKRRLPLTRPASGKAGGMTSALPAAIPARAQRGTFAATRPIQPPTQPPQIAQPAPVTPAQHSDSAPGPQGSQSLNEGASLGGGMAR